MTPEIIARDAQLAEISADEIGWVIEHGASDTSRPRYWSGKSWDGLSEWTYDNLLAIRFARQIDAGRVAAGMDDGVPGNYRIAEHMWVGPKPTDAPQTEGDK